MRSIIFRNPRITYRKEDYGGLINLGLELYIIDEEGYNFLKKLDNIKFILEENLNSKEKIILEKFIPKGIVVRTDYEKIKDKIQKVI
ncbi:MAG: hypothetical protein ABIA78_01300 [archaeon]